MSRPSESGKQGPGDNTSIEDVRENEEAMRKVLAVLAYRAHRARMSPIDFFTFVMRNEHTQQPLILAPHQKVYFDFIMMHEKCVIMLPVGHSKTFSAVSLLLWYLGHNPTMRGALVCAKHDLAIKPIKMLKDYIEQSSELKMVFPNLRRHPNAKWTEDKITVDRPMGIKDASLVGIGLDGAIMGSRLNFLLVDDILDRENTSGPAQRAKVYEFLDSSLMTRMDPEESKVIVMNTAWNSRDLIHELARNPGPAWPTLKMSADGKVWIYNSDFGCPGFPGEHDLRDSPEESEGPGDHPCRLVAHDPDPYNETTLFPLRFTKEALERIRNGMLPIEFARAYLNDVRNNEDAWCKKEYIDLCKTQGIGRTMAESYRGSDPTFTGVDLAVSANETSDSTSFFTFRVLPDGRRLILDVEYGRFSGPDIVAKMIDKSMRFGSVVIVENNACQDFVRQFATAASPIPIKAHTTGRTKAHPEYGVQGLFLEMAQKAWIIPCNMAGEMAPGVKRWVEECLEYTPSNHTGDCLMACYFARELAKKMGCSWDPVGENDEKKQMAGIAAGIMSR